VSAVESVAVTVKDAETPAVVGVPDRTPSELSSSPAGALPVVTAKVYGAVPPDAVSVVEYASF
jgi:hypothetical protein